MTVEYEVLGAEYLSALARRLKEAGDVGLRRELLRGIRKAAKPLKDAAVAGAIADLPKRGGLNLLVAHDRFSVRTRTTGGNPGVRLIVTGKRGAKRVASMDRGILRHPVFGNRNVWKDQTIKPGWFTKPVEKVAPQARADVVDAMHTVAEQIMR